MHQLLCVGALVQEALGSCLSLSRLARPASSVLELHAPCGLACTCDYSPVPQYHKFPCRTVSRQPRQQTGQLPAIH
jgi:hypothetical protein